MCRKRVEVQNFEIMKTVFVAVVTAFLVCPQYVAGDIYLHNPRGSNNRLNEHRTARANANRLFDSQNNNKGGYNVGDKYATASSSEKTQYNMKYFQSGKDYKIHSGKTAKSLYTIEWTNQHGCGDKDLNCNIVIQYKCQPDPNYHKLHPNTIRNGRQTMTSKYRYLSLRHRTTKDRALVRDSTSYYRGLHEPWEWYDKDKCYRRTRNYGLFTADQRLRGTSSRFTRQNPNGNRYGYECPEERDYYPYWHPTDWIDIAVLAHNTSLCHYYRKESFNVKGKGECLQYYPTKSQSFRHWSTHNNKIDCEKDKGIWVEFSNYLEESPLHRTERECKAASTESHRLIWAIPYRSENIDNLKMRGNQMGSLHRCLVALDPPECKKAPYTRSNHLGNSHNVVPLNYTWVFPHFPSKKVQRCALRIRYNISTGDYPPFNTFSDQNDNPKNGVHPVRNNPKVKVGYVQLPLQLAINTAQFGRTFQDRSHIFKLLPRPKTVSQTAVIYNLNVRGKRGNIVQVYPAVEYDFIPKRLKINSTDLVHIQWTGSNTNPSGNDGQGTARTDRSNMVEMAEPSVNYPLTSEKVLTMFENADIIWASDLETKTKQDLILSMASSGYYNNMSMSKAAPIKKAQLNDLLNNAPASYYGMLLRFKPGHYYYMCTRNNNFTNRNQKGRLQVCSYQAP